MKLYHGKRVVHERLGEGTVVTPRVKGGWTTVNFGDGIALKCDAIFLSEPQRKAA